MCRKLLTILLLSLAYATSSPVLYQHHSGFMIFDQDTHSRQAQVPHINSPLILYSISTLQTPSYFSYWSTSQKADGFPNDNFTILVRVGGVATFKLGVQYLIMEQMPFLEVTMVNLTSSRPQKQYQSTKNLSFSESTFLTTYLIGFTSSNYTHDNYFYAVQGKSNYSIYTRINLTQGNWIAFNLIILSGKYEKDGFNCEGSSIQSESEVASNKSPLTISFQQSVEVMVGIEAFHSSVSDFVYNRVDQRVVIQEGIFSYSATGLNMACVNMESDRAAFTPRGRVYFALAILFGVLTALEVVGILVFCLCSRYSGRNRKSVNLNTTQRNECPEKEESEDERNEDGVALETNTRLKSVESSKGSSDV